MDHCKTKTLQVPTFCCISCFWSCSFRIRSSFSHSCCCLNCMASCRLKMGEKGRLGSIGILSWSFTNSEQLFYKTYTQLDFFHTSPSELKNIFDRVLQFTPWTVSRSPSFETYVWVRIKLLHLNLFLPFLYLGTW